MKITNSDINLSSDRFYAHAQEKKETLRVVRDNQQQEITSEKSLNDKIKEMFDKDLKKMSEAAEIPETNSENGFKFEIPEKEKQKIILLEEMMKALTGKDFKIDLGESYKLEEESYEKIKLEAISKKISEKSTNIKSQNTKVEKSDNAEEPQGEVIFREYTKYEANYEYERVEFKASGKVFTEDGREIEINLNLDFKRSLATESFIRITEGQLIDPLVINYDGTLPELTDEKYEFDLTFNGKMESISFTKPGSGFIALDRNNDGVINDGRELFGAKTGDGFGELAKFDDDKNGWIDKNDSVFKDLKIFTKDSDGNDILYSLDELGIGAIYLSSVDTLFSFKNAETGQTYGEMAETGIFLRENGVAGTVHHIDLVV
ncbi:MAG: hypothetical protein WC002_02630 [Candidatus Muiribacteriota bacterium]